jgi:hypothetical protein
MAFQKQGFKRSGGGGQAALSLTLSAKSGREYIKCALTGLWVNDAGGPSHKGSLSGDRLAQVLEFLSNAYDAGASVSVALFDNSERPAGGFKKPASGGFKKPGGFSKKPNPFKKQQEEEESGEEDPGFGED